MKVLILGANGLLGTSLSEYLSSENGISVIRSSRTKGDCADASSLESLSLLVERNSPDFIINLVALTNVDECETNPYEAYRLNALTCKNLATLKESKEFKIIHISTDHFYHNGNSSENDLHPLNYYALSKLLGESFLEEKALILRTNFFGKGRVTKKSFTDWIFKELSDKKQINLFEDSFFSPLSIDFLSQSILYLLKNYRTGTFNIGSKEGMSKYDFGMKFAELSNLDLHLINKINISSLKLSALRPLDMRMNSQKFENSFKYPLPTLENLIIEEAKKYRE